MSLLKKREAEIQITKEDNEEEEKLNSSNTSFETWNKASEEILSERRFVKLKKMTFLFYFNYFNSLNS